MLQSAVAIDPLLQKGLWLLGIDAVQRGDDAQAIEYWERLLDQLEPNSPIAASVHEQIDLALTRTGMPPPAPDSNEGPWPGVKIEIDLNDVARQAFDSEPTPDTAVLFVIIRDSVVTGGPPLGVARINQPQFPIEMTVDDSHAMLQQNRLSEQPRLRLQARLSLTGQVASGAGDWESEAIDIGTDSPGPYSISLVRQVE